MGLKQDGAEAVDAPAAPSYAALPEGLIVAFIVEEGP